MKALLKKSLMFAALVLMSASVSAVVNAATGVFQWSGVAPTENISKGICIRGCLALFIFQSTCIGSHIIINASASVLA